jgi:effector-binding domain-containing protein
MSGYEENPPILFHQEYGVIVPNLSETPRIETRNYSNYAAIRILADMQHLTDASSCFVKVYAWLNSKKLNPSGPPFYRYLTFDKTGKMTLEIGVIISNPISSEGEIVGGFLPAGKYALVDYWGDYSGLQQATSRLLNWASVNDIEFQKTDTESKSSCTARLEYYLTDPASEPDPEKWQTQVAILVK